MSHRQLGQLLIEAGLIDEWQLKLGIRAQRRTGTYLGEALVWDRLLDERSLLGILSRQLSVPFVQLGRTYALCSDETRFSLGDPSVIQAMPAPVARQYGVFPLAFRKTLRGTELVIATADPNSSGLMKELAWLLDCPVTPLLASRREISDAIFRFYGDDNDDGSSERMPHPSTHREIRVHEQAYAIA